MKAKPVYYEQMDDGYYCSVDGQPDYFKTHFEMYQFACEEQREVIEITDENYQELYNSGALGGNQ